MQEDCRRKCPELARRWTLVDRTAPLTGLIWEEDDRESPHWDDYERLATGPCEGPQPIERTVNLRFQRLRKRIGLATTKTMVTYKCCNSVLEAERAANTDHL